MPWTIATGPEDVHLGGYDGTIWRWQFRHGERAAAVLVKVTGTAMWTVDEALPGRTAAAKATHGRSEAERFALWFEPPRSVQLSTWSGPPTVEGGSADSPEDAAALERIVAWLDARGVLLAIEEVGDGWDAIVLRPGACYAQFPEGGWGSTRLEAAEAARARYEAGVEQIGQIPISDTPAIDVHISDARIEEPTPAQEEGERGDEVSSAIGVPGQGNQGVFAKEGLPTKSLGLRGDDLERLDALAARAQWLLAWVLEPDGHWRYFVVDPKTGDVLQHGLAADWDDARLSAIENLYPPSDEDLGGRASGSS
jgi:hypothetical protein